MDTTDTFRNAEQLVKRVGAATQRSGGEEATIGAANVQHEGASSEHYKKIVVCFRFSFQNSSWTMHGSHWFRCAATILILVFVVCCAACGNR